MPSPGASPITNTASPSAMRNASELLPPPNSPNYSHSHGPNYSIPTEQWTITRFSNAINSSAQTDNSEAADDQAILDDSIEYIQPAATTQATSTAPVRRSLMGIMRNVASASSGNPDGRRRHVRHAVPPASANFPNSDELFSSFVMQLAGNGASGFEAIANNINASTARGANAGGPRSQERNASPLRHKVVYQLRCVYCVQKVCSRAMKAILLADTKIELYSTDIPPMMLQLLDEDRMTQGCNCRIRDTVCTCCGNVLGYHVSQPCDRCLDAKNNGHFWMFYSETIQAYERSDPAGNGKPLYWGSLSPMREHDEPLFPELRRYEMFCR